MKRGFIAVLVAAFVALAAAPARADLFSVSADLPFQLSLKADDETLGVDSVSGYAVGVSLPFLVGLGVESYEGKLAKKDAGDSTLKVNMYDLFFNLPIPIVNIAIGFGMGTGEFTGDAADGYKTANYTQYLLSLGIPFAVVFDVHLGYHNFNGTHGGKGTNSDIKVAGEMLSLGVKVGF